MGLIYPRLLQLQLFSEGSYAVSLIWLKTHNNIICRSEEKDYAHEKQAAATALTPMSTVYMLACECELWSCFMGKNEVSFIIFLLLNKFLIRGK